jgi:subtilisin family serine protease
MTVVSANLFILAPLIITIGHFRAAAVGPADRWQQRSERESRAEYINSWAVKILGGPAVADDIARRNGYENIGLAAGLPDVYHFQLSIRPDTSYTSSLALEKFVEFAEQQFLQQLVPKSYATPEDPLFEKQWNLLNTGQNGEQYKGKDLKVEKAWLQGLTGCNVTVTVVDEGIEFRHPDLWPNFAPLVSYGFLEGDVDPTKLDHGTRCSGVIAAMKDNAICGVGVAHECTLGSERISYIGFVNTIITGAGIVVR